MIEEDKEEQISEEGLVEEEAVETPEAAEEVAEEEVSEEQTADEIEQLLADEEPLEETVEAEEEAVEAEEAKPRRRKKEEEEEEFAEERIYTIPLGKAWVRPPKKRAPRAMQLIKDFIIKHMKMDMRAEVEEERGEMPRLVITNDVNEKVWSRSIEKPPRKIRVRAAKDSEGNITVFLAEGD